MGKPFFTLLVFLEFCLLARTVSSAVAVGLLRLSTGLATEQMPALWNAGMGRKGSDDAETLGMSQVHTQPVSSVTFLFSSLCLSIIWCMGLASALCQETWMIKSQCLFLPLVTVIWKMANIPQTFVVYLAQNYFHIPNKLI